MSMGNRGKITHTKKIKQCKSIDINSHTYQGLLWCTWQRREGDNVGEIYHCIKKPTEKNFWPVVDNGGSIIPVLSSRGHAHKFA